MKYFVPFLALGAIAQAATPVRRQTSPSGVVRAAIELIVSDANALNDAVAGFTGVADIGPVGEAIARLQNDVDTGAQEIAAIEPLSDEDALALSNLVGPLQDSTSAAVDTVIGQRDAIVAACAGQIAYSSFQSLIPSAQTLADNLASKIPELYRPVIDSASNNIQASLNRGLEAFADQAELPAECDNGGTPPTDGTTTTPPTDGTTTTAPPPGGEYGTTTTPPTYGTTTLPGVYPSSTSTRYPTGSNSTTSRPPVATYVGGAAAGAIANFGVVALAVAAAAL